jgi:hypothetical protein
MDRIDERAGGRLHEDCHETAEGKGESDSSGIPAARRQIRGQERAKSGLHVG